MLLNAGQGSVRLEGQRPSVDLQVDAVLRALVVLHAKPELGLRDSPCRLPAFHIVVNPEAHGVPGTGPAAPERQLPRHLNPVIRAATPERRGQVITPIAPLQRGGVSQIPHGLEVVLVEDIEVVAAGGAGAMRGIVVIEEMDPGSAFAIAVQRGSSQNAGGASLIAFLGRCGVGGAVESREDQHVARRCRADSASDIDLVDAIARGAQHDNIGEVFADPGFRVHPRLQVFPDADGNPGNEPDFAASRGAMAFGDLPGVLHEARQGRDIFEHLARPEEGRRATEVQLQPVEIIARQGFVEEAQKARSHFLFRVVPSPGKAVRGAVNASGNRGADEQIGPFDLLGRAAVPSPGFIAGVGIVHAERCIHCHIVFSGALDVDPHEIVTIFDHLREKMVQELVGVGRLSASDVLHRPAVNMEASSVPQWVAVDIGGPGIGIPLLDVVPPQLAVRASPPGQIIVDPDEDSERIHSNIGQVGHHPGNVLWIPAILVIDDPVTVGVENQPGRPFRIHFNRSIK